MAIHFPALLSGKSHGRRSLIGYSPWGCKELDTTERLHFHFNHSYGFSSRFQIVVPENTLESLVGCKEIKPINPKGNQPQIFIGRTVAEAPILWPPDANSRLTGKDRRQEEKRAAEDEMVGGITNAMDMNLSKFWETAEDRGA